jgi:hypothetical protein
MIGTILGIIILILWIMVGIISFVDCVTKGDASWTMFWLVYSMLMLMIVAYYFTEWSAIK